MTTPDTGSHAAAGEKKGGLLWLWLLLGAIALGLAIWALVELLDDDDELEAAVVPEETVVVPTETVEGTAPDPTVTVEDLTTATVTTTETAAPTGDPVTTETVEAPPAPAGPVLLADVLAAGPDELAALVGRPVTAESVQVVELVADEAFYVGPGEGSTILVRLVPFAGAEAPESPFQVEEGSDVDFTGTLEPLTPELVSSLRLYDPAEELELGDYYVQVEEITGVR